MILLTYFCLFLLFVLCIKHIHLHPDMGPEWLSHDKTSYLNSFFITAVFFSHIGQCGLDLCSAEIYAYRILIPGQLIVTTFFFFSGYGLMSNILKQGDSYVRSLILTRLPKLLLHFTIAVLLFVLIGSILGRTYTLERIALSLIGWESVGNSNWFIFMTLLCYLLMWGAFRLTSARRAVIGTMFFIMMLCAANVVINHFKALFWVDTVLCMPAGMILCLMKQRIALLMQIRYLPPLVMGILLASLGYVVHIYAPGIGFHFHFPIWMAASAGSIMYVLGLTLAYGCISFKRIPKALVWVGGAGLFPLYIFQRIPMMVGKHYLINSWSATVYIIICMVATIGLAIIASYLFKKLDRAVFSPSGKK